MGHVLNVHNHTSTNGYIMHVIPNITSSYKLIQLQLSLASALAPTWHHSYKQTLKLSIYTVQYYTVHYMHTRSCMVTILLCMCSSTLIYSVTLNSQCQHLHCMLHSPLHTYVHICMHLAPLACPAHPHDAKHLPTT